MKTIGKMRKYNQLTCALLSFTFMFLLTAFLGCGGGEKERHPSFEPPTYSSYRDIPGVTEDEIKAIEALKKEYEYFVYAMPLSTEAFENKDGEIRGFALLFSKWLTELFGIPFRLELRNWLDILDGFQTGEVHFSSELTPTPARHLAYHMTSAIISRPLKSFRLAGSESFAEIAKVRPLRHGFITGTATINSVTAALDGDYEIVELDNFTQTIEALKNGSIDAFYYSFPAEIEFAKYSDIVATDFYPLIRMPVSLATQTSALWPIITVMEKMLQDGDIHYISEMYNQGYWEYTKYKLFTRFTEEEIAYINANPVIRFSAEHDNYPVSFFDTYSKKWAGIAFDVIEELEFLIGFKLSMVHDQHTNFFELIQMLESGYSQMHVGLIQSAAREGRFLWPSSSFKTGYPALISKMEHRAINIHEIYSVRVGLNTNTVFTELFHRWFPEHNQIIEYESQNESFNALMRGEVDMVMNNQSGLLHLTHYMERSGFKINVTFDQPYKSTFGFHIDEVVLRSIIDKALELIDTDRISGQWLQKTFDYRIKIAEAQRPWLIGAIALSVAIMALVSVLFARSRSAEKKLERQVELRTNELRLQTERASSASRAKSAFLANMSHEIRTPMNSIMGFAELAMDKTDEPQIEDYLGKIKDSTRWLLRIINDILDVSKIEAGKMELESVPFNLQDIISRCQSVILPGLKDKGLELELYVDPLAGKKLLGDPVRLYQVVMNLLSNAVKFTNTGFIKFSSLVKNLDNGRVTVCFEVKDSGIGMSHEQTEKVFTPFIQADSSTTRNYGGTGLGLAIVKNIVELMGGELSVESAPGLGSTFSFEITFETIDVSSGDESDNGSYEIIEKPHFDGLILICDDNSMNREVVCEHLARIGIETIAAENGKEAVDIVTNRTQNGEKPFDLIFMDIFMPVMDGLETASKIIELNIGTPIVAMTANVMISELDNYRKNGMPDHLGKPFTSQELWRVLLKYLTPISSSVIDNDEQTQGNDELLRKLRINFVKSNQTTYDDIVNAIESNDIKLAHRLAHTLKGSAGMIEQTALQKAAAKIEESLKDGENFASDEKMSILKKELMSVLEELKPMLDTSEKIRTALSPKEISALFEKLEPMLANINPECINMLDDLRAVPGAEELARHIENYDFESAAETLTVLKNRMPV